MSEDDVAEVLDSGDANAEKNARKEEIRRARADADVVRSILKSPEGRDWLYRKLKAWHLYATLEEGGATFFPGQTDVTAFRLGEENCAKQLESEIRNASIELYVTMLKDQRADQKRLDNLRREERQKREAETKPLTAEQAMTIDLPPPPGYGGTPSTPKKKK